MTRLLSLFLFLTFGFSSLNAQIDEQTPQEEVEIIRFDEDGNEAPVNQGSSEKHLIKVAPLAFIWGSLPFYYEYEMTSWLGIQVGAGLTFKAPGSDIQSDLYEELNDEDCEFYGCSNYYDYSYRKGNLGYLFAVSPRLYFHSDGLEGPYFAPEFRFTRRNSSAQKPDPSNPYEVVRLDDAYDEEKINFTDLMAQFGVQTLHPNLSVDWSVGIGVRKTKGTWQVIDIDDNGSFISSTPEQIKSNLRFEVGFKLGFRL